MEYFDKLKTAMLSTLNEVLVNPEDRISQPALCEKISLDVKYKLALASLLSDPEFASFGCKPGKGGGIYRKVSTDVVVE